MAALIVKPLMNKPFHYKFHDEQDPKKTPRYLLISPVELSRVQQHKILNDYLQEHREEHYFGDGKLIQIPLPPDIQ